MEKVDAAASAKEAQEEILLNAILRFERTENPRLRQIMLGLIRHLHAFVREAGLTWAEWEQGMEVFARGASVTREGRNEFIALSDALGLSMQVLATSQPKPKGATLPTLIGPFFVQNAPEYENGSDISNGAQGEPLFVQGRVLDTSGAALPGSLIDIWQSDERGLYDVQDNFDGANLWGRGRIRTDAKGRYSFWSVMPTAYAAPMDAALGDLILNTTGKYWRPAHLHFAVRPPDGADPVVTHIFVRDSKYIDEDVAFGVRPALIADFTRHPAGSLAPDGRKMDRAFRTLDYDFVLTRGGI